MRQRDHGVTAAQGGAGADLVALGLANGVLTLTYSEFGRRPRQSGNGESAGTDHGTAGTMFVLGGGVMGSGIVHLLLTGGFEAQLWDINPPAIAKGLTSVRATFDYHLKNRKITAEELERMISGRLHATTALSELPEADPVI